MERKNKRLSVLVVILCFMLLSLGVAFALLSTTLNIEGVAAVESASWDVHFDYSNNSGGPINGGMVEGIEYGELALTGFDITLTKPGDGMVYNFEVVNEGTIPAAISFVEVGKPSCTSDNQDEADLLCNNLTYTFTYGDGSEIKVGDKLSVGDRKSLKLYLIFNNEATMVPSNEVSVTGLSAKMIFAQD